MMPSADFAPGTVLGGRYRIVSVLGRGGMGEVYRADDLTRGEVVALKFLPRHLASDPARVAQLTDDVRIGRPILHSNVCRIHAIGVVNGRHYLSMDHRRRNHSLAAARVGRLSVTGARDLVSCARVGAREGRPAP